MFGFGCCAAAESPLAGSLISIAIAFESSVPATEHDESVSVRCRCLRKTCLDVFSFESLLLRSVKLVGLEMHFNYDLLRMLELEMHLNSGVYK